MAPLDVNDDLELVRQARAGSAEAFTALVRLHQRSVRAFIARSVRPADVADDLAQDVFLSAYRSLDQFQGDGALLAWLLGIARHKVLTHLRSQARRQRRETLHLATALAEWRAHWVEDDSPEWEAAALQTRLRECIDRLAPTSRQVIEEHYFQNCSAEAIGARLGKSGGSVRMLLLRIRQALATCLRGPAPEE